MPDIPITRGSLLLRLRNVHDNHAWQEFVDLYGPVIYGFARKRGLQDADAVDFMQQVFQAVTTAIGRFDYDPKRGLFRGWLFGLIRRQFSHWARDDKRVPAGGVDTAMIQGIADRTVEEEEAILELEYQRRLFQWACERVKTTVASQTWQAFWAASVENKPPADVAQELGINVGAVYTAKCRILERIRKEIQQVEDAD